MNGSLIAISTTSDDLKLAEINRVNGDQIVRSLVLHRNRSKDNLDVSDAIRSFIREKDPKTLKTVIVLGSQDIEYRDFIFPFDSLKKVTKTIGFEILSEYPPNDYIFDHIKSIAREPGIYAFWAAIARKELLSKRIKDAEDAGLQIVGITSDISTLGNYFFDKDEALVLEMGEGHTLFALYIHGIPVLFRDIPIGVKEILKTSHNMTDSSFKSLTGEIKRTIHSFNDRTGLNLRQLYITGNLLLHREILNAFDRELDLEFVEQTPQDGGLRVLEQDDDLNVYASLLGAAKWRKKGQSFNFFKNEFIKVDPDTVARNILRWGTAIVVSILISVFFSSWLDIVVLEKRKQFLDASIRETFSNAFPQVRKIVDPVRQARNLLNAGRIEPGRGSLPMERSVLDALEDLSRAIPKNTSFQIINLFWEGGKIEINGRTDSFKTVNVIQESLSRVQSFSGVNISNARQRNEGQDVEFKITINTSS